VFLIVSNKIETLKHKNPLKRIQNEKIFPNIFEMPGR
jgi:hypothetical protein